MSVIGRPNLKSAGRENKTWKVLISEESKMFTFSTFELKKFVVSV